ncbi:hypothetical protein HYW36_03135 [Candidatus Saccharibacteria bacterium]|nr:hypothetical protein [Candidatus Saccharibacteria bacterium]
MISDKFVIFAALLNLWGSLGYAYLTLKGKVKPNRVTFSLWALAPLVAFGAQIGEGVGLQSLMTFMVGFGPLIVLTASFMNKKAYWRLKKFDYVCGGLSLLGLALWALTGEGNMAIAFAILADGLAALPTVVKSYIAPQTENWLLYFLGVISAGITMLTIDTWTFAYWGFPVYILLICALISALVKFKLGTKFPLKFAT